ncbi:uncharacterized protein A1O9_11860 [Exophiala aquamarina CBS 119918]|uniref:GPI inositol-deacylase winged helix domain-containing protein n=1 Tax=Exophiala aquamarina CBS 119918 TaxID=1182545 RepID=A0A072NYY8_9EURO|nr:uncharacterized protein A1O9_11860 [Exophiala aquamarina CBS 119918]KEF52233.1 hypothetical protein A1O9_11860 [Exophiala aquamarina CBS 119918]
MCRVVRKLFEQNKPVRLVLDGLDECGVPVRAEEHDWNQFFALLESMPPDWKVLIVSRSNNWFNKILLTNLRKTLGHVELTTLENREDIHQYVLEEVERVSEYHQWGNQIKEEVILALLEKANGMFVWVSLLCNMLEEDGDGFDEDHIRTIIRDLPRDLAELYGRSLRNLPDGGGLGKNMRLALRWTLCAYRPMTIKQLQAALPFGPTLEEAMKRNIGTLIKIDSTSKEVQLCHASARDYIYSPEAALFGDKAMSEPELVASTHSVLLNRCLKSLCDTDPPPNLPEDRAAAEEYLRKFLDRFPLVEYSCISWIQHLREVWRVDHDVKESKAVLDRFLGADQPVLLWLQIFHFQWNMDYPGTENTNKAIFRLVYTDPSTDTWKHFLRVHYADFVDHLGWEDGGKFTRWDRFTHRRHRYDFRHPARLFQSPTCMSTTSVAAFFNYSTALEAMARRGQDLDVKGQLGGTPLHWAASGGSCASIKVLLAAKANLEAGYNPEMKETPIFRALRVPRAVKTRPGRFPAAKLLFDAGAKLHHLGKTNGFLDGTALIALIESNKDSEGAAEFANLILRKDRCWKWYDVRYGTPLHAAAHHGRPLIMNALLKDGYLRGRVDFQGSDTRLKAALHDACSRDNPVCVEELLKAGANPNLPAYLNGFTPLHYSVLSSRKSSSVLLQGGADPNLRDGAGSCPVHLATTVDLPLYIQAFVDKGYDIDAADGNGDTALSIALRNANFDIAKQMLARGADPDRVASDFQVFLPAEETDEGLLQIRKRNWRPLQSYAYLFAIRQAFAKHGLSLPIPVFGRVLDFLGHRDVLEATRKGRFTVNEAMVRTMSHPYITSQPIIGNHPYPVQMLEFKVLGQCQDFGGQRHHSYYEIDTIEGRSKSHVRWKPHLSRFGHNSRPLAEKTNIFERKTSLVSYTFHSLPFIQQVSNEKLHSHRKTKDSGFSSPVTVSRSFPWWSSQGGKTRPRGPASRCG